MRSITHITTIFMMLSLIAAGTVFGNHAFAKTYHKGEVPTTEPTSDKKKRTVEEARALVEEAKQKALDTLQKKPTTIQLKKTKHSEDYQKVMDAAKAEAMKKIEAAKSTVKTTNK